VEHAALAAAGALSAVAPSLRRVVAWLRANHHLNEVQAKAVLEGAEHESKRPPESPVFYGLIVRYWMVNMEEPGAVLFSFRDGRKPGASAMSPGRMALELYLPTYQAKFVNQAALTELVGLLSVGFLPPVNANQVPPLTLPLEGGALSGIAGGSIEGVINEVKNGD
jgi:hypothetical protein